MYETWIESGIGWYGRCSGTISGVRSHDSPRQPHHRAFCPRFFSGIRGGPEGSPLSVKAMSAAENSEGAALKKLPGASRDPIRLVRLLRGIEANGATEHGDLGVAEIAYDSRKVKPGTLFVAIHGEKTDGNKFVLDAIARGAIAIVSEQARPEPIPSEFPWIKVPDARKALASVAANYFGRPAEVLKLVGLTGTNGKTTTSYLVDSILRAAGCEVGLFGTIAYRLVRETRPAIFTNLTRDHLDYHKNFDDYFAAKRRLFEGTGAAAPGAGVINRDDAYGKQLAGLAARTLTYGLEPGADITTRKPAISISGLEFTAETPIGKIEVRSHLVGRINVYNILAAIGAGVALDLSRDVITNGIAQLSSVPGRFERIDAGQPFLVIVDYAHTDDALRNLLATAKELNPDGRIITLFGCGGDRDRTKRPLMGEAAGRLSDIVVLTSDNPRSEDPLLIINDAIVGLQRTGTKFLVEPDRERAIEIALDQARPGDIVLLAGKGHETSQVLRDRTIDFDDREIARRMLHQRGYGE